MLAFILALVLHVTPESGLTPAIDSARTVYQSSGETTTIYLAPGTYYEEITIDVPGIKLINARSANKRASVQTVVSNGGVSIGDNAVRLSWYYGHGYQYASMGPNRPNYGGSRERLWNASVLVTAQDFYAEGIIFENSFNLYVSPQEAQDTLVDLSDAPFEWSEKERPKRRMPDRPKTPYSTDVQRKFYRERASALSFASGATNAVLRNCRVVGRQDAFYGAHGASVTVENSILCGAVDYIFGGMDLTVTNSELVAMVTDEKGDRCYIAAGRGYCPNYDEEGKDRNAQTVAIDSIPTNEYAKQGMIFRNCTVRYATEDELINAHANERRYQINAEGNKHPERVYLCRPWRWWGMHMFENVTAAPGVLNPEPISLGLTKGHPTPFVYIKNK